MDWAIVFKIAQHSATQNSTAQHRASLKPRVARLPENESVRRTEDHTHCMEAGRQAGRQGRGWLARKQEGREAGRQGRSSNHRLVAKLI